MKLVFGGLLFVVVLVAVLVGLLQIKPLRQNLLQYGLAQINQGDTKVTIGDLSGEWPRHVHIDNLTIADAKGIWLSLKQADLTWAPLSLFTGEIHIVDFDANNLTVARAPEDSSNAPVEKETPGNPFDLPRLPFALKIERGAVRDISLGRGLVRPGEVGELAHLDLTTTLELAHETLDLSMEIERKDSVTGRLIAQTLYSPQAHALTLSLDLADGDKTHKGLLAELGGPDFGPLKLTASATTSKGILSGQMMFDGGKVLQVKSSVNGQWTRELAFKIAAEASGTYVKRNLEGVVDADSASVATDFFWSRKDDVTLENMNVVAGPMSLTGKATIASVSLSAPHLFAASGHIKGIDTLLDKSGIEAFSDMGFQIDASLDMRSNSADVSALQLTSPVGGALYTGTTALDFSTLKGELAITLNDISPLSKLAGQKLAGAATLNLSPFAIDDKGNIISDFVLHTENADMGDPILNRLVSNVTADGSALLPAKGGFAIPSISVTPLSGAYTFKGTVAASASDALSGEAHFSASKIETILTDGEAKGAVKADITFSGSLSEPAAHILASLNDGELGGIKTETLTLDAAPKTNGYGPLVLQFKGAPGNAKLNGQVGLPRDGGVGLHTISANIFGSKLTGNVELDKASLITASLKGEHVIFAPFGDILGVPINGSGDFTLSMKPISNKQSLTLALTSGRIDAEGLTLDRVKIDADVSDLFNDAKVNSTVTASSGQFNLTHLDDVQFSAQGPLSKLALDLAVTGKHESANPKPFALNFQSVLRSAKTTALDLNTLKLALGKASASLTKPVTLQLANGVSAKAIALDIAGASGSGAITGDFAMGATTRMKFKLDHVPLDLSALALPAGRIAGNASGTVDLDTGTARGALALTFNNVRLAQGFDEQRPPFNAKFNGTWAKGRFDVNAVAEGVSTQPFQLAASLPVVAPRGAAFPMLAQRGAVKGSLNWDGPLDTLAALVDLNGQKVGGDAKVSMSAEGDISAPRVNGEVLWTKGTYENFATGTVLKNIDARLTGHSSQSLDFNLTATDGEAGHMEGHGQIALDKKSLQAIAISAQVDNMHLVRRADLDTVIDGALNLNGPAFPPTLEAPATLSGALTTRTMHITIPDSLPADVPLVEVVEINGTTAQGATSIDGKSDPLPLLLNMTLATSKPVRISGRGLDSLWNGNFAVAGRIDEPLVKGDLNSERGTLDFAGKTFTLTKGNVTFPGTFPVEPNFNVTLTFKRDDFTANIVAEGDNAKPKITLTSTPSLPKDEILSRILFDKGVGELSAMETLQLARTLAELSGVSIGGTGGGIMNRVQETLSLDVLRIDSGASGATTVQAGKYIQEGIYVGVEQGALASDSSVKVEINVTPKISVETKVGQNASGEVGVNWKWDY